MHQSAALICLCGCDLAFTLTKQLPRNPGRFRQGHGFFLLDSFWRGKVILRSAVHVFYTSYSMPLFDIKGTTITPALSSSTAKLSLTGVETKENSLRVRLNYAF
jgi:hypothetical protein